jgi:hypothetical protein
MSNILKDRRADILKAFEQGLDQCIETLDEHLALPKDRLKDEAPRAFLMLSFEFRKAGMEITSMPELDLGKPLPDLDTRAKVLRAVG